LTGAFMLALALLALRAWRAERTVGAGRAAAIVAGFGTMLLFAINWSTTFLDPAAAKVAPGFINNTPPAILVAGYFGSLVVFALAWVAYSVVMLRGGAFPRLPVVLILVAALGCALPFVPFAMTAFGIGFVWLGVAASRTSEPAPLPGEMRTPDPVI
jgi:hypothetical protein